MILASEGDEIARMMVAAWAPRAVLLTPRDLSAPGWRLAVAEAGESRWACGGVARGEGSIAAVLSRLIQVDPLELHWIRPASRPFVAGEMTAFLLAWLEGLHCPVIDRPCPGCLCGRNWGWPHWAHLAGRLGIPVGKHEPESADAQIVNVVGDAVIAHGPPTGISTGWARRLAAAAGQELACFEFDAKDSGLTLVQARVGLETVGAAELAALWNLLERRIQPR